MEQGILKRKENAESDAVDVSENSEQDAATSGIKMKRDILKRMRILAKRAVLTKTFKPSVIRERTTNAILSLKIHHGDSTLCKCTSSKAPK